MSDTRIVLVKPGDVLMLGNVTLPENEGDLDLFLMALSTLKDTLGLAHDILVFEDDIDLAVKPGNWYDQGGALPSARETVYNDSGHPIPVSTEDHVRHGLEYAHDRYGKKRG
jgi:hypothetical protein